MLPFDSPRRLHSFPDKSIRALSPVDQDARRVRHAPPSIASCALALAIVGAVPFSGCHLDGAGAGDAGAKDVLAENLSLPTGADDGGHLLSEQELLARCRLETLNGRFIASVFAERCPDFGLGLRESVTLALLEESERLGLDPMLLLGLIQVESRFDPLARSGAGARGLVQLRPATARHLAEQASLFLSNEEIYGDPEWQLRLGARYLAELEQRFQRIEWALMAYNAGPTRLQRLLRQRGALVTYEGYPRAVLKEKERFEAERTLFEARLGGGAFRLSCEPTR